MAAKKKQPTIQLGITYIIVEADTPHICKVGSTKSLHSLKRRLSNLQSGNSRELQVVCYWGYKEGAFLNHHPLAGQWLENVLLRAFTEYRILGREWLAVPAQAVVDYVKGLPQ